MTIYAVDRYQDKITVKHIKTVKQQKEYHEMLRQTNYYYFTDDEDAAKRYIVRRALLEFEKAKTALQKASDRHAKCIKKFGSKP